MSADTQSDLTETEIEELQAFLDDETDEVPSTEEIREQYQTFRTAHLLAHDPSINSLVEWAADDGEAAVDRYRAPSGFGDVSLGELEDVHEEGTGDSEDGDEDDDDGVWVNIEAEVQAVLDTNSDSVFDRYLMGDDEGLAVVAVFQDAASEMGLETSLEEGDSVRFETLVTESYEGRISLKATVVADYEHIEYDPDVPEQTVPFEVFVVDTAHDVEENMSGLIKRCSHDGCTRVLDNATCSHSDHGTIDNPEYDLRLKLVVAAGDEDYVFILDEEATSTLTGLTLEEAKEMAYDAGETTKVLEEMREHLLGRTIGGTVDDQDVAMMVDDVYLIGDAPDPNGTLAEAREFKANFAADAESA